MELTPTQALAEFESLLRDDPDFRKQYTPYQFTQWLRDNDITLKE